MTLANSHADVVVVGMGAAGGIAASVLTQAGLDVVGLEAGPRLHRTDMTLDEIRNEVDHWLCEAKSAREMPTFRASPEAETVALPYPVLMANCVGGSALHYPGTSPRLFPWNFRARTETLERYGPQALDADSMTVDWPISYGDLEPFYGEVERAIGISGLAGNVAGTARPGGNPFEGPRSQDYPMPPLRRSGWTELMSTAARDLGWSPFPTPTAINSEPYDGRPACTYCGFCENNGCYNGAKGSPDVNVIARAEASGRFRLLTSARAVRIEVDETGRACGVRYMKDGEERLQRANVVLLAAHTYENVRLLLLSKSPRHQGGLGNGRGQVGLAFTPHINPEAFGVFPGVDLRLQTGSWAQGVCVDDWNGDNFDHAGFGFNSGGMLTAAHELLKPIALSQTLPPQVPRWGTAWKRWIAANARSVATANAQFDAQPYRGNGLDLDPRHRDELGMPLIRITYRPREADFLAQRFLVERLKEWLQAAGASETWSSDALFVEARTAYGGVRMGEDPGSSVVDPFCFAHDTPNLGVLGCCTFPTAGGHNPTLTIQALAWRTAQDLVDRWDERQKPPG